jgi:hypothetical protein
MQKIAWEITWDNSGAEHSFGFVMDLARCVFSPSPMRRCGLSRPPSAARPDLKVKIPAAKVVRQKKNSTTLSALLRCGRPRVHRLRANQHEVFALTRSTDSIPLKEIGAEPVIPNALDAAAVKATNRRSPNHLTTSRAQWATVFAACSIAATVTSGCAIMLG